MYQIQKGSNLSEIVMLSIVPGYWMKICCVSARAVITIGANKNDPYLVEVGELVNKLTNNCIFFPPKYLPC